jgi:uncharacterized protein involved in outer membrane biogenesis
MKIVKLFLKWGIIFLIGLGVILFFFQEQIVKTALIYGVKRKANLRLKIGHLESRLQKGYIKIEDMIIFNPKGFKEPRLAEIDSLLLELNLPKLLKGEVAFRKLFIDIDKIFIIRQKEGTNLVEAQKPFRKTTRRKSVKKKPREVSVEDLRISVSEVIYKNYRVYPPKMLRIELGFKQKYRNVSNLKKVFSSIMVKNVLKSTFSNLFSQLEEGSESAGSILDKFLDIFK